MSTNANHKIASLDGLRAVSVTIVFLSHVGLGYFIPGGLGVTVFFFLSGYLITTLLLNEYSRYGDIDYLGFFVRRFLRLMPPLVLFIIFSYTLQYFGFVGGDATLSGFFSQLFYFFNYYAIINNWSGVPTGTSSLWSLAIEEHFYLLFPFVLFSLLSSGGLKSAARFIIGLCVLVLIWRFYLFYILDESSLRVTYATDTRVDSILFGCFFALSIFDSTINRNVNDSRYIIFYLPLFVFMILISLVIRDEGFRSVFRFTLQSFSMIFLFYYILTVRYGFIYDFLNSKIISKIGVYSYTIYLFHYAVIEALKNSGFFSSYLYVGFFSIVVTLFIAYLVDRYVDAYFLRLRSSFRRSPSN